MNRTPKFGLVVETGVARDRNQTNRPYAKFEFNVQRLLRNSRARNAFLSAMNDLLPAGGYRELCEDGHVLYAEFSADFTGLHMADYDAYSPRMTEGGWLPSADTLETINLNDGTGFREYAFTIYQKSQQERVIHHHRRREITLRVEAKRRFNRTRRYRTIRLAELPGIDNPFASLGIYERARLGDAFRAGRDQNFFRIAQRYGLQTAFSGTRGNDRERRERRLASCHVDWWEPDEAWAGVHDAVLSAMDFEQR